MAEVAEIQYPSEWFGGKRMGSVIKYNKRNKDDVSEFVGWLAISKDDNDKEERKPFMFYHFNNDEELTKNEADKYVKYRSDKYGKTKNQMRYIDKNTIEVNVGEQKYMKTDAKHISIIEEYFLHVNHKSSTDAKEYIIYQSKAVHGQFAKLISGFKYTTYLNNDVYDCRLENLKEYGTIVINKNNYKDHNFELDQYELLSIENYDELPKNKWILGKPCGTTYKIDNKQYYVRVDDNDKKSHTKTINISDYGSEHEAEQFAIKLKYNISYKTNRTKNLVKIIDNNIIEIKLSNDKIFTTNIFLLPFVQQAEWIDYLDHKIYHCGTCIDGKYKRFETFLNLPPIVHNDGNLMNKQLDNIFFYKLPKQNECFIDMKNSISINIPMLKIKRTYSKLAYTQQDINNYIEYIINFIDHNKLSKFEIYSCANNDDYVLCKQFLNSIIDFIYTNINFDYIKFIPIMNDNYQKKRMFEGYVQHFMMRIQVAKEKINLINSLIDKSHYDTNYTKFTNMYIPTKDITLELDNQTDNEKDQCVNEITDDKICNQPSTHNNIVESIDKILLKKKIKQTKSIIETVEEDNSEEYEVNYTSRTTMDYKDRVDPDRCIKKFKDLVSKKGGESLFEDENYKNAHTKLKVKCKDNHEFTITLSNLNLGRWCPECSAHTSELLAIKLIEHMFKKSFNKIRPDWLKNAEGNNIELDGYNEELKLAIEYNGIQHYIYSKHFHRTEQALEKQQNHDAIKKQLCKENNVNLLVIPYTIDNDDMGRYIYDQTTKLGYKPGSHDDFDPETINALAGKHEKILDIIKSKQGVLLKGLYTDAMSEFLIRCENNHEFTTKSKYLTIGTWCDDCARTMTLDKKNNISAGMKKYRETDKGKQQLIESHEKRSATMKIDRDRLRQSITEKYCGYCQESHPVSDYGIKNDSKDGFQAYCRKAYGLIKKDRRTKGLST